MSQDIDDHKIVATETVVVVQLLSSALPVLFF